MFVVTSKAVESYQNILFKVFHVLAGQQNTSDQTLPFPKLAGFPGQCPPWYYPRLHTARPTTRPTPRHLWTNDHTLQVGFCVQQHFQPPNTSELMILHCVQLCLLQLLLRRAILLAHLTILWLWWAFVTACSPFGGLL